MFTIVILALMAAGPGVVAEASSTASRVRSTDDALAGLIDQATRRSETFRRLLATIQASNGIVYVEPGECGHGVRACLKMWMQVSGPNRFVRIVINSSKTDRDTEVMGSIGHELQHAIEVLSEPAVTNGVTMFNFLKRMAPTDGNRFETTAAVSSGEAVIYELRTRRAAGQADADGVLAQSRQVPALGGVIQPVPIQAALDLLKWSPDRVPTIEVVEVRPPLVSPLAEGWTMYNGDGSARPTIYVAGWSALYRAALANRLDAHFDVIRLAGVLAHERAHVEHGPNEELAYIAQLIVLESLQAHDIDLANVRRALEAVKRQQRGRH